MCFYYDDVCYVSVHRESIVKARKPHKCDSCRKQFPAGQQYLRIFTVCDGYPDTTKICNTCCQDAVAIHRKELRDGCEGAESWCPWEELARTIRYGNADQWFEPEFPGDEETDRLVLSWPYDVPPAAQQIDLRTLPELVANS